MKYIIFTDLDGTLLDHETYSFEKALAALSLVNEKKIPLVICTSKTQSEIEVYREKLGNNDPFISENGGAVIIPKNYFKTIIAKNSDRYIMIELGTPYAAIIATLSEIKKHSNATIRGFSDMTPEEVSAMTGIDIASAKLSKKRFYSEPIIIEGNAETITDVKKRILASGMNFAEGGRFYHVLSTNTDKGKAVTILKNIYKENSNDSIKTIGLGDSLNDLPMLSVVDIPVLVKKTSGNFDTKIKLSNLVYANGIGPDGWNRVLLEILNG
ncbi:MAG: HAD-IIB family hydrolase [Candidatus Brocadiaceae bacterium]|nr:HAD-IIB family hydrolase [Candidatus Brocadiaceae bacterium]